MEKKYDVEIQILMKLSKKIKQAQGHIQALTTDYLNKLNQLLYDGWSYALGKENELDESLLPDEYIKNRNRVIDNLQIQLGLIAGRYRAAPGGSKEDKEAIAEYHKTFFELIRITGKIIGLDPDSELPDEDMPKEYVDYWLNN